VLSFNFCLFQGLLQLGGLPVAVHCYLERFLCELSLVLYLLAAYYEQYCCLFCCKRASVLVMACLFFLSVIQLFLRGCSGTTCFIP